MAKRDILGIVGGLGPLASAEFVKTIYDHCHGEQEQDSPVVLMHSDPTFPDRTQSLLAGECYLLLNKLNEIVNDLCELGATRIVICCITIHYLLPMLPRESRERVISLLDVIFTLVAESRKRHLLISTTGARKLRIYEQHVQWQSLKDQVIMPDEMDQTLIHNTIYQIKKQRDISEVAPILQALLSKYDTDSFIAGCTEIHLLTKHLTLSGYRERVGCIDPLTAIANDLAQGRFWDHYPEQSRESQIAEVY